MENLDSNSELTDDQIDTLVDGESSSSANIPMRDTASPTPTSWSEDVIKVNGKEVKGTREQILQWAQLGHGYPQKAQEFNQMKARVDEWSKRQQELDERDQKWKPYKEVDEFATKNPEWWQQVQESYKNKIAGAQSNPELAALKEELAELKKFRDEISTDKKVAKEQEEDQKLVGEVDSIRKSYPDIDFDTPDEEGSSLEMKVLKHAVDNGMNSFKAAFRDYYHDQLLAKAEERGKSQVAKDIQKRTKLGILGETSKPTKGLRVAENVQNKSYEDLEREIKQELGIA
jgi:hypothetical protein